MFVLLTLPNVDAHRNFRLDIWFSTITLIERKMYKDKRRQDISFVKENHALRKYVLLPIHM